MYKIDEIMEMLDCNKSIEMQEKGIKLAKNVKGINVFIMPKHLICNKNVWKNCAKILVTKTDEELLPYLTKMLRWLEDLILERMRKVSEEYMSFAIEINTNIAKETNKENWLINLAELLENEKLKEKLSEHTLNILKNYYKKI